MLEASFLTVPVTFLLLSSRFSTQINHRMIVQLILSMCFNPTNIGDNHYNGISKKETKSILKISYLETLPRSCSLNWVYFSTKEYYQTPDLEP